MKYIILISLLVVISGCTTVEFVRKDTAPVKQGLLRYSAPSSPEKQTKYMTEVSKKATEFCGGPYTVNREYQAREASGGSTGIGTGFGLGGGASIFLGGSNSNTSMYNFVEFTCK